ncbi:aminotransferase class IV family protein [Roseobacteraceae bacterium NS-SX3]
MESPLCTGAEFRAGPAFRLIETFGFHPGEGIRHLDLHLARMARSAAALGLPFDGKEARALAARPSAEAPLRCRLTMDATGRFELSATPLGPPPAAWRVQIAGQRLDAGDPWLRHKTTQRQLYDQARAALPATVDELVFLNQRGEACEGTITNLFAVLRDGRMVTPPVSSGLLPGVLRQHLLETGQCVEKTLHLDDLHAARALFVGNSLRGLIKAELSREEDGRGG